jgi:hypothetical protein
VCGLSVISDQLSAALSNALPTTDNRRPTTSYSSSSTLQYASLMNRDQLLIRAPCAA